MAAQTSMKGKVIGNFEIIEEIGRGAMGVVFKARQISMDRIVALKFLPKALAQNEKRVQRFVREAHAAGKLSHPNLVAVHDVGQIDGLHYISMEFIDGTTTYKELKEQGPYKEEQVIEIGLQVAAALKEAHEHKILHRDIKPDNFLIDKTARVRVADLGLARFEREGGEEGHLTQDGTALGTPHYMSPEQARGTEVDARCDLYCLGASLYFLASGKTLFDGPTAASILVKVISDAPRPLKDVAEVSPGLSAVVDKLLQKDPAKRFQTADEVIEALEQVRAGTYSAKGAKPGAKGRTTGPLNKITSANKTTTGPQPKVGTGKVAKVTTGPAVRIGARKAAADADGEGEEKKGISPMLLAGIGGGVALVVVIAIFALRGNKENTEQADKPIETPAPSAKLPAPSLTPAQPSKPSAEAQKEAAEEARKKQAEALAKEALAELKTLNDAQAAARSVPEYRQVIDDLEKFKTKYEKLPVAEEAKRSIESARKALLDKAGADKDAALSDAKAGKLPEARKALEDLTAALNDKELSDKVGIDAALEEIARLEKVAADKQAAADKDKLRLADAVKKADADIRGKDSRFQFEAARGEFTGAMKDLSTPEAKEAAKLWDERYKRAGAIFVATGDAIKKGAKITVPGLGRFTKPGEIVGWQANGIEFDTKGPLAVQIVPHKEIDTAVVSEVAFQIGQADATGEKLLNMGLFSYSVGDYMRALELLEKAMKDESLKKLAKEPFEQAWSLYKEDQAARKFAAAKAAFEKSDTAALLKELAPMLAGGDLANTEFVLKNADEIAKLEIFAKGSSAAGGGDKPAQGASSPEALEKAGWKVSGTWTPDPKRPGVYKVKDGKLVHDNSDASVQVMIKPADKNTKVGIWVRYKEGRQSEMKTMADNWKLDKVEEFVKNMADGYGVEWSNGQGKIFGPPKDVPNLGKQRRLPGWLRDIAQMPSKVGEFSLTGQQRIGVSAKGDTLDIGVPGTTPYHSTRNIIDTGDMVISIQGEAEVEMPQFQILSK